MLFLHGSWLFVQFPPVSLSLPLVRVLNNLNFCSNISSPIKIFFLSAMHVHPALEGNNCFFICVPIRSILIQDILSCTLLIICVVGMWVPQGWAESYSSDILSTLAVPVAWKALIRMGLIHLICTTREFIARDLRWSGSLLTFLLVVLSAQNGKFFTFCLFIFRLLFFLLYYLIEGSTTHNHECSVFRFLDSIKNAKDKSCG